MMNLNLKYPQSKEGVHGVHFNSNYQKNKQ